MIKKAFIKGFEKKAAPFEKLRQAIMSPKNINRGRLGMAITAPAAVAYGGYKAIDKAIGAPSPQHDI
jgi:hypothetical protein